MTHDHIIHALCNWAAPQSFPASTANRELRSETIHRRDAEYAEKIQILNHRGTEGTGESLGYSQNSSACSASRRLIALHSPV